LCPPAKRKKDLTSLEKPTYPPRGEMENFSHLFTLGVPMKSVAQAHSVVETKMHAPHPLKNRFTKNNPATVQSCT